MKFKDKFANACRREWKPLSTQRSYWHHAKNFIHWLGAKNEEALNQDHTENFKEYVSSLAGDVAPSTQDQAFHALRFLFEKVLDVRLGDLKGIARSARHEIMVDVPPLEIARQLCESVHGMPGLVLRCQLAGALRVSDALRIRVKDLDFKRKQIAIQQSKGGKSRMVPMSPNLVEELKHLLFERAKLHKVDLVNGFGWVHLPGRLEKKYPGQGTSLEWQWLYYSDRISTDPETGHKGRFHLLPAVIQKEMKAARERLKIEKHYTPHSLRHATAQFWEREGIPVSDIQRLLGHSDVETTQRYLLSGRSGLPKNLPTPI